jgi:predicted metallopeptidase
MSKLRFHPASELQETLAKIVYALGLRYIDPSRVHIVFSTGSKSSAYARIWGIPRPFIEIGICKPHYVIEIVTENILSLRNCEDIVNVFVHELLHIPRSFSGGLRGHGAWSRYNNIRRVASKIPSNIARELCEKVKVRAESLAGKGHG